MKRRNFIKQAGIAGLFVSTSDVRDKLSAFAPSVRDNFLTEEKRDITVEGEYDVIVCGAGPAGVSAAIEAGRNGSKTLLVEAHGCLGGVWTSGLLTWILDERNK